MGYSRSPVGVFKNADNSSSLMLIFSSAFFSAYLCLRRLFLAVSDVGGLPRFSEDEDGGAGGVEEEGDEEEEEDPPNKPMYDLYLLLPMEVLVLSVRSDKNFESPGSPRPNMPRNALNMSVVCSNHRVVCEMGQRDSKGNITFVSKKP
jgi:hypothetical protein